MTTPKQHTLGEPLTVREVQILRLLAEGLNGIEVGQRLWIALDTVKTHRHHIFVKLGAHTGAHAVAIGYQRGWLRLRVPVQEVA